MIADSGEGKIRARWSLRDRTQRFPSVVAVSDLPLGGNLALLQPRAWLLWSQRRKGVQCAWERRARCPSLALRYQIIFGNRCCYLLKGFKGGRQGWAARCFPEMIRLALEGPFPVLEPFKVLPAPLFVAGGWQERTAPLRLSASGQRVNPRVSDLQPSPRCSLARDPLGNP